MPHTQILTPPDAEQLILEAYECLHDPSARITPALRHLLGRLLPDYRARVAEARAVESRVQAALFPAPTARRPSGTAPAATPLAAPPDRASERPTNDASARPTHRPAARRPSGVQQAAPAAPTVQQQVAARRPRRPDGTFDHGFVVEETVRRSGHDRR